jgi:hypothetical protein
MTDGVVRVDAFLCDAVDGVGGKLYALGVGWNQIFAAQFPTRHPRIGVGLIFHVPYTATNQPHDFNIRVDDQDSQPVPLAQVPPETEGIAPAAARWIENGNLYRVGGQVNVGRPPNLAPGDEQVVAISAQLDQVQFDHPGVYAVVVEITGDEAARLRFRVQQLQIVGPVLAGQ